jgi:hypothetical protein
MTNNLYNQIREGMQRMYHQYFDLLDEEMLDLLEAQQLSKNRRSK